MAEDAATPPQVMVGDEELGVTLRSYGNPDAPSALEFYGPFDFKGYQHASGLQPLWKVARDRAMAASSVWIILDGLAVDLLGPPGNLFFLVFALWHIPLMLLAWANWRDMRPGWVASTKKVGIMVTVVGYVLCIFTGPLSSGYPFSIGYLSAALLVAIGARLFSLAQHNHHRANVDPGDHTAMVRNLCYQTAFRQTLFNVALLAAVVSNPTTMERFFPWIPSADGRGTDDVTLFHVILWPAGVLLCVSLQTATVFAFCAASPPDGVPLEVAARLERGPMRVTRGRLWKEWRAARATEWLVAGACSLPVGFTVTSAVSALLE